MEKGIDSDNEYYGGQKRTRFPCLAVVRYVVAAVVSVLTVVVVVMVTIVAVRPEEVIFSIPHQYINVDRQWWVSSNNNSMAPAAVQTTTGRLNVATATSTVNRPNAGTATSTTIPAVDINSNFGSGASTETTTYSAVKRVFIWVMLTADNPSGRADISGENVIIRVLDMPDYSSSFSFQGLKEIVTYELQKERFIVKRQTLHTLSKWVLVNDSAVMSYLAGTYGGRTSFTAMVQVTATIAPASKAPMSMTSTKGTGGGKEEEPSTKAQIYYCWPVIVGLVDTSGGYAKTASCRPKKEMDSPVPPAVPAPAPAPTAAAPYYY